MDVGPGGVDLSARIMVHGLGPTLGLNDIVQCIVNHYVGSLIVPVGFEHSDLKQFDSLIFRQFF